MNFLSFFQKFPNGKTFGKMLLDYKGSGRGRLGAPRPPWRVRVECEEVFVLELSGTHELHTINTTYQVADVRPSGLR